MSHPIPFFDPFRPGHEDVPTAQQQLQRAVEDATVAAVMPFEREKRLVTRDHVAMQQSIWGSSFSEPFNQNFSGRKA